MCQFTVQSLEFLQLKQIPKLLISSMSIILLSWHISNYNMNQSNRITLVFLIATQCCHSAVLPLEQMQFCVLFLSNS